jgi:hypothetical protein
MSQSSEAIQRCTIAGYLYGIICPQFKVYDVIGDAEIFALRSNQKTATANPTENDTGDSKTTIRTAGEDEIKRLSGGEGAFVGRTDKRGFFCLNDPNYKGELLDVYVCLRAVPGPKEKSLPLKRTTCLFLGTYSPRPVERGWYLQLYIPQSIWCSLKKLVDAWTVAGRVATCEGDHALGNVTVIARDVDITQNDLLGEAVTNSLGIFRIDYMGDAFRQGTIVDVELFGGPDIYFEVKDSGGTSILTEDPGRGRKPGRCDSGPCKCVNLCVPIPNGNSTDDLPSAWIRVGTAFLLPDSTVSLHDFDANGFAGAQKFVLTGAPAMRGGVPRKTSGGDPIEYRFLVGNTTAANNVAPLTAAHFTRIVGAGPIADKNLFTSTQLGDVFRVVSFSPYVTDTVTIVAVLSDLSVDGWLDVNKVIEHRFIEQGRDPSTISSFSWIPSGDMMLVNTGAIPTVANVPAGAAIAGQPVPVADRLPVEKMSIRFETRNATSHVALPGSGKTLNSMVVNNNPIFLKVAIKEQQDAGNACGIVHGVPHIAYTVYHPHLESADVHIYSNSLAYNQHLSDPPLPLSSNTNPAIANLNNPALEVVPHPTDKCTYIVILSGRSRRHTGGGQVNGENHLPIAFYFEPMP